MNSTKGMQELAYKEVSLIANEAKAITDKIRALKSIAQSPSEHRVKTISKTSMRIIQRYSKLLQIHNSRRKLRAITAVQTRWKMLLTLRRRLRH